jgi:hypothetical protein
MQVASHPVDVPGVNARLLVARRPVHIPGVNACCQTPSTRTWRQCLLPDAQYTYLASMQVARRPAHVPGASVQVARRPAHVPGVSASCQTPSTRTGRQCNLLDAQSMQLQYMRWVILGSNSLALNLKGNHAEHAMLEIKK